jgi:hypothetical protein
MNSWDAVSLFSTGGADDAAILPAKGDAVGKLNRRRCDAHSNPSYIDSAVRVVDLLWRLTQGALRSRASGQFATS